MSKAIKISREMKSNIKKLPLNPLSNHLLALAIKNETEIEKIEKTIIELRHKLIKKGL